VSTIKIIRIIKVIGIISHTEIIRQTEISLPKTRTNLIIKSHDIKANKRRPLINRISIIIIGRISILRRKRTNTILISIRIGDLGRKIIEIQRKDKKIGRSPGIETPETGTIGRRIEITTSTIQISLRIDKEDMKKTGGPDQGINTPEDDNSIKPKFD
jgi:hypothetical protein